MVVAIRVENEIVMHGCTRMSTFSHHDDEDIKITLEETSGDDPVGRLSRVHARSHVDVYAVSEVYGSVVRLETQGIVLRIDGTSENKHIRVFETTSHVDDSPFHHSLHMLIGTVASPLRSWAVSYVNYSGSDGIRTPTSLLHSHFLDLLEEAVSK